jgi:hypothetical protein
MRELFQLLAARARHPQLRMKPAEFLDPDDLKTLQESLKQLTDTEVAAYLQSIDDDDLKAMLRIAKMKRIDAKVTNLLTLIAEAGRVSGWTEEPGVPRDLFNNIYFSVTGEISLNYLLAVLAGRKVATPLSGESLYDLSRGKGHPAAWLQYLNVTVDIRSVLNTVARLTHRELADKELKQPFPYAPRLSDLAAYEFRVFGFPLLMFHKRGLIIADLAAYRKDYAYGLLGVKIVEHFCTREALESEIRAGRVVALGYVRVPSVRGGWKETDLAVFAHRISNGKYRGKTALIIYGLKAYVEHSELIGRERRRFEAFERGLREGAVIEQLLAAEPAAALPARSFEPVLHAGPGTAEEFFDPLLGSLSELRRYALRPAWGLPLEEAERRQAIALREQLAARGIQVAEGNPLVGVDPFSSSFVYRRRVDGQEQEVKVIRVPSLADIEREHQKAEDAVLIEEARRDAAARRGAGVILINQALEIDGRLEMGPLLRNPEGEVRGAGLISGTNAFEAFFAVIEAWPVADRARLRFNRFAATVVDLDADGDGASERVFVTVEFPSGEVRREWTNPLSGERETLVFVRGQWREAFTDRWILELDYDAANVETGSRTYANRGSQHAPVRGGLIEETRTLDFWFRDLNRPGLDPYQPTISKLRINYGTGELLRETYGLFPLPVEVVDDQHLTRNRYTPHGLFESARVFDNGQSESDFGRPARERVLRPVAGRERYRLTSRGAGLSTLRESSATGYQISLERADLIKGLVATETRDAAHAGRKTSESRVDAFDGTRVFSSTVTFEYEEDFRYGLVPVRTRTASTLSGARLAGTTVIAYDPFRRRLTAVEEDHTGAVRTNTWDYRWTNPVEVETAQRRVVQTYDRDETAVQATTTVRSSGEILQSSTGRYDASRKTFEVTRQVWHRPGILHRVETQTYSALGRLIASRIGDTFETRPDYDVDGREVSRTTFRRAAATDQFTVPHRQEDDYRWQSGGRNARVRTWLDGISYDEYGAMLDAEGRTVVDGIRHLPPLELRTILTYDGGSERVLRAEVMQNGAVRVTHRALGEIRQPDGAYWLRVELVPAWGLVCTNSYLLGDPLGRTVAVDFENGNRVETVEWFASAPIAKVSELHDRHGRLLERFRHQPNAGTEAGLAYDRVTRYRVGPWGDAAVAEERAVVRGTDLPLFREAPDARVCFDLSRLEESPRWAVDPQGLRGLRMTVAGVERSNVTAVFRSRLRERPDPRAPNGPSERVQELERIDLDGLFYHQVSRRILDRLGNVLEERTGKVENLGPQSYTEDAVFTAATGAAVTRTSTYRYEPGWMSENIETGTGVRQITFTRSRPSPEARSWRVNDAGWREWPTQVHGHQATTESQLDMEGTGRYLFRHLHEPRLLQQNPHLPGVPGFWLAWTSTELNENGKRLFDAETLFDARGNASTIVARKINRLGQPAAKIAYQLPLPAPEAWQAVAQSSGVETLRLRLAGSEDLSGCDFLAFYLDAPADSSVQLQVRDSAGHQASVSNAEDTPRREGFSFWPVDQGLVQWLPTEIAPERGSAVAPPVGWRSAGQVFVVSVPELAQAGLEVQRVASLDLGVGLNQRTNIRVSPLYRLAHRGAQLVPEEARQVVCDLQTHDSGLETATQTRHRRTAAEIRTERGRESIVWYHGQPVGFASSRPQPPYYSIVRLTDYADPDLPRPLYALAAADGAFLESYQTLRAGDTHVYSITRGFQTPQLEVFRAAVLDDEISPGRVAFGRTYPVTIPLAKGGGALSMALARLRNRCAASAFTLGGSRLLDFVFDFGPDQAELSRMMQELRPAAAQAQEINGLPTLARALMPMREIPWTRAAPDRAAPADFGSGAIPPRLHLNALATRYPKTRLIPTAPGTEVEPFVETVQEGAIIELAVHLNELPLAGELLNFYWEKSQGGTNRLLASYDARTGAPLVREPRYERASDANATAEAQLAIAEAAFRVAVATGDTNALNLGQRLVSLVLTEFQPALDDMTWPRGIADRSAKGTITRQGVTLWPEARKFSLKTNARAYLLFRRILQLGDKYPLEPGWRERVLRAAREQAAWLTERILPEVERTGVVPRGLFEIQDVHTKTRALAVERWTAADDWLTFLEAADLLGVSQARTHFWLENLARVHGVRMHGVWGLDWSVALLRPDAVSPELTAKFVRVARQLGHHQAAAFAQRNLDLLREADLMWPVVVTTASPQLLLPTGQGSTLYPLASGSKGRERPYSPAGWPETLSVYAQQAGAAWLTNQPSRNVMAPRPLEQRDITQFLWIAAGFYLSILAATLFWWSLSSVRKRRKARAQASSGGSLVPPAVRQKAEERWAKRVLGRRVPAGAERSLYSNGAIEQNFHMQLRAIYKLVLEWRRVVHGWSETDERLVEEGGDEWLNGIDEFAVLIGIYSRWVVKAGKKDGRRQPDALQENEDSNHIWSRLVIYFSEPHMGLLGLLKEFKADPRTATVLGANDQIELVLRTMGVRARPTPFDARVAFDAPNDPAALDLLVLQQPGASLGRVVEEMERCLGIPGEHVVAFIRSFKSFKEREDLLPVHPYLLELAKVLPHFVLMGLVGFVWYNVEYGGLRIFPYLKGLATEMALDWYSLTWAAPLFAGYALSVTAYFMEVHRYRWRTRSPAKASMVLDATLASLFVREGQAATPAIRTGWKWNPVVYRRTGWVFRGLGLVWLGITLLDLEPPTFATFMIVKGLAVPILLVEALGILLPLVISRFAMGLEDRVTADPRAGGVLRFVNQLNLVPTRPASLLWHSLRYHFQPSVPTGGLSAMLRAIAFYLVFAALFFLVGSYMYKQALEFWFQETYRAGRDLGLLLGGILFWNTMYLLRFGLFVSVAALSSALALSPVRVVGGLIALGWAGLQALEHPFSRTLDAHPLFTGSVLVTGLALMALEPELLAWLRNLPPLRARAVRLREKERQSLETTRRDPEHALGVVYMSGDDLSFYKLTPDLLVTRLQILRDRLGSGGLRLLHRLRPWSDDGALAQEFKRLYELEKKHDVTLWHPLQLVIAGERPSLRPELGLNLVVEDAVQRDQLVAAWHLRRWLVTMMSTAGHAQDTAINLVDIALRLAHEDLGAHTVFYLIQNKYDQQDNNRPSQVRYDQGELGQRNKLARLLMEVAPGCRAYSLNDWTPFGFKAGGLVGMDLVYEESLKLNQMLILDRNATAHDLDAVVADLQVALGDPGVIIVIPGRSTTNTLTPVGQSSQLIEEGQRALTRGIMLLGGTGAETLGTGWGNIQAVYYGRVQTALCDPDVAKLPLTTASRRGAPFGDQFEGLIGFGPHAVGISEDIWGVTQAAHNGLALGYRIKFHRSKALWHKMRESWSHAEWLSAFPRWSGGYLQMMLDPLMQRINDEGPLPVFAKEIRANGGRFFLSAPSALLSILLMPLAIIWDVSPFVQILILLWNVGFVMNQVLTALGLVACLESTGFNRATAVAGTAGLGFAAATVEALSPFAVPLMGLGFLAGGFAMGLGRWLYYRGRDVVLFGPQLVIHALGQIVRQSLEFVLSGASANDAQAVNIAFRAWVGPREDRPFDGYQNFVNLRTVVWGVGLASLSLNLFALANLDFLNALLLLPSLMFSVSALVGPFVMTPKPGSCLGWAWLPRLLGWVASLMFYGLVAGLVARGGWQEWLGLGLGVVCFGAVLRVGLRYWGYPRQLRQVMEQLAGRIAEGGMSAPEADALAKTIVRSWGGDADKTRAALRKAGLAEDAQAAVGQMLQDQVLPCLRRPVSDLQKGQSAGSRSVCEFKRAFVLGLFTFLWFFIVPIPGLLAFTAPGGYRFVMPLTTVVLVIGAVVGSVLLGYGLSLLLERGVLHGLTGEGLVARIDAQYRRFQSVAREPGRLTALQTASLFALFTDLQTHTDQRGYAHARRTLGLIEQTLHAVPKPD